MYPLAIKVPHGKVFIPIVDGCNYAAFDAVGPIF